MTKMYFILTLSFIMIGMGFSSVAKNNVKCDVASSIEMMRATKKFMMTQSSITEAVNLKAESTPNAYGLCISESHWTSNKTGLYSFDKYEPLKITKEFGINKHISSGTYYDGYYYIQTSILNEAQTDYSEIDFWKMNGQTGEFTHITSWLKDRVFCCDMTYDYSTKKIIGIVRTGETKSAMLSIDIETGKYEAVGGKETPGTYMAFTCSYDGKLYAVNNKGAFVSIDRKTGAAKTIGNTGSKPDMYLQSMDFDHNEGVIYWATTSGGKGIFGKIDPATGAFESAGNIGRNAVFISLHIPFETPANEYAVTIEMPTNGTIEVLDGNTVVKNGDMVKTGTELQIIATANPKYEQTAILVNGKAIEGNTFKVIKSTTIAATFELLNGVNDNEDMNLRIYPNPVKETINIGGDFTSVKLFNSIGQNVGNYTTSPINVSNLTDGIYILKVENSDLSTTRKIVIRK